MRHTPQRRTHTLTLTTAIAAALLAPALAATTGCESTPDRVSDSEASRLAYDDRLIGEWQTESGDRLVIRETKGQYALESTPASGEPWTAPAWLHMIGGGPIVEIDLTPDSDDDDRKDAAPVVHYARLWVSDRGRLIHQPLRAGWLADQAARTPGLELGSLVPFSEEPSAQASTAVGSRARLHSLLRRAQLDRTAWAQPEVFTRVP